VAGDSVPKTFGCAIENRHHCHNRGNGIQGTGTGCGASLSLRDLGRFADKDSGPAILPLNPGTSQQSLEWAAKA
jgi:hypothetical protein